MMTREKKMKAKVKKSNIKLGHSNSINKEATEQNLWPDLPQKLINLIATNSSLMKDLYSKGLTKSWRAESRRCKSNNNLTPPWILLSPENVKHHNQPHAFNILFRIGCFWYCCHPRPNLYWGTCHFLGCSNGFIAAKGISDSDSAKYFLWNPYPLSGGWNIPSWDTKVPFLSASVSSFPLTENREKAESIVMVLTGISCPAFVYYRIWEFGKEWMKKDSRMVDPHCCDPNQRDHLLRFGNGVWLKEKFYALSLAGTVAVVEDVGDDFRITAIGKRVVPSIGSMHYRECMIEPGGKILVVFLISRKCVNKVDYVEVYQLNVFELTWIKKESLGDLTLFLGVHCSMKVSAKKVGCRGNSIYFSISSGNSWSVYQMETNTISLVAPTEFLEWVDPTL